MIIRKKNNIFIIKILKEKLNNFNIFNQDNIKELFQNILTKIKEKHDLNGLLNIDVYLNEYYGMIIEIKPIYYYKNEIDMKIHFHLDCIFLSEINTKELTKLKNTYLYRNKYYTIYKNIADSNIIYKTNDILEKGIKIT